MFPKVYSLLQREISSKKSMHGLPVTMSMFGWKGIVKNVIFGGSSLYSGENRTRSLKIPPEMK